MLGGGRTLEIKQGGCCPGRGESRAHQAVGGSGNNANSQTGSSEEGLGRNENKKHYSALWNC